MTYDHDKVFRDCDSPIEAILIPALLDVFHDGVKWQQQKPFSCRREYRVDLWASHAGRSVVVECDGKDFHDYRDDERRDADMLESGLVTDVIRFGGACIAYDKDECVRWVARYLPFLIDSQAGRLSVDDLVDHSRGLARSFAKPILRSQAPGPVAAHNTAVETYHPWCRGRRGFYHQFRWPYLERRARSFGLMKIGDAMTLGDWGLMKAAMATRMN